MGILNSDIPMINIYYIAARDASASLKSKLPMYSLTFS